MRQWSMQILLRKRSCRLMQARTFTGNKDIAGNKVQKTRKESTQKTPSKALC
jgi:hypothetical protein